MESKYRYDQPPLMENEESFQQWRKSILLWITVTDIPKEKQAIAVVLTLKGKARKTALEINTEDLTNDDGIKILLNKLDRVLNIDSMTIYKIFREFDLLRHNHFGQIKTYVKTFNDLYDRLREVGIVISEDFLILKLLSGAQLSNTEVQDILSGMEKGSRESAIMNLLLYDIKPKTLEFKSNGTPIEFRTVLAATSTIKNKSEQDIFKSPSVSDPKACSKFTLGSFHFPALDDKLLKGQQPHGNLFAVNKSPNKPGLSNLSVPPIGSSLFGGVDVTNQASTKSIFGASQTVKTSDQQTPLVAIKNKSQWDCTGCYTTNEPTDSVCPCCGEPNPSAPASTKAGCVIKSSLPDFPQFQGGNGNPFDSLNFPQFQGGNGNPFDSNYISPQGRVRQVIRQARRRLKK